MAGLALRQFAADPKVGGPAVLGLDADVFQALACTAAAIALPFRRTRGWVAVGLLLAISYTLSARRLAGTLGPDALAFAPIAIAAFIIWWPPLLPGPTTDD